MSSYEHYDKTSANYDRTRWPIGLEIIVGCLTQGHVPLAQMTVLDAGCGTGNYTAALLPHVRRIEALDRSPGMLEVAAPKLGDAIAAGRVALHRGEIAAVPLADASVDGIMVNQVLHHLADDPQAGWPRHRRVLGELSRVLKPGGVMAINTCSAHQMARGFWAVHLIPDASALMIRRLMPLDALEDALIAHGIAPRGRFVPTDAVLQGAEYFDPRGPLRADWRAGDSIWALVDEGKLAEVEHRLRQLDAVGELDTYVAQHDAMRPHVGQVTLLYGIKT